MLTAIVGPRTPDTAKEVVAVAGRGAGRGYPGVLQRRLHVLSGGPDSCLPWCDDVCAQWEARAAPHSTVAGAMVLPTINVRQGMFDGTAYALPPLYTSPQQSENNSKQHFHRNLEHLGIPKRPGAAKPETRKDLTRACWNGTLVPWKSLALRNPYALQNSASRPAW